MSLSLPRLLLAVPLAAYGLQACTQTPAPGSSVMTFSASGATAVAGVSDAASAMAKAKDLGYLPAGGCGSMLVGGEELVYAWDDTDKILDAGDTKNESAEASGTLVKTPGGIYYLQSMVEREATPAEPPGFIGGYNPVTNSALSSWNVSDYFNVVCMTVFNAADTGSLLKTPFYDKASAAIVDLKGGSGGFEYSHSRVLGLTFEQSAARAGLSASQSHPLVTTLYLKQSYGPVALETVRTDPSGRQSAVRVFLNEAGGYGIAGSATSDHDMVASCQVPTVATYNPLNQWLSTANVCAGGAAGCVGWTAAPTFSTADTYCGALITWATTYAQCKDVRLRDNAFMGDAAYWDGTKNLCYDVVTITEPDAKGHLEYQLLDQQRYNQAAQGH